MYNCKRCSYDNKVIPAVYLVYIIIDGQDDGHLPACAYCVSNLSGELTESFADGEIRLLSITRLPVHG